MIAQRPFEVLVVEDEALIRMVAVDAITAAGMTTREAGDAAEALRVLESYHEIGLLFTDVNLPGAMCGLDLSHQVHGICADMEMIVTSGAQSITQSDLRNDGTFLPKPYSSDQLMEIVHLKSRRWLTRMGRN